MDILLLEMDIILLRLLKMEVLLFQHSAEGVDFLVVEGVSVLELLQLSLVARISLDYLSLEGVDFLLSIYN